MNFIDITLFDENGDYEIHKLPSKYNVCDHCEGKGTHVNPNIDRNGISSEEFRDDPDFTKAYFAGVYDIQCTKCKGLRVIAVVDSDRLSTDQREVYEKWIKQEIESAKFNSEWRREQEMESRMLGCWD